MFAAGIIPYNIFNGKLCFLLGLENGKWSGFVGGSESNEEPIDTAIREFNEETALIFYDDLYKIREQLTKTTPIVDKTSSGKTVYLWFISYQNDISRFHENISKLNNKIYLEKKDIRWFSVNEIKNSNNIFKKLKDAIINQLLYTSTSQT